MVFFCPICGNMLLVGLGETGNHLFCSTCPYKHAIEMVSMINSTFTFEFLTILFFLKPIAKKTMFKVKQFEDVVNWEMAEEGEEECNACFVSKSLQFACRIETDAEETVFFKCQGCGNQWRF